MTIETNRMYIRALTLIELIKYSKGENPFDEIKINLSENEIDKSLQPVLLNTIIPNVKINKNEYLFYTLWLLVDKKFNMSVGSIMFKGKPGKDKQVEIEYGTHEEFRDKGYMTEAIEALCKWAFNTGSVKAVIAETAKDNNASFRVLEKNGFRKFDENNEYYYWKTEIIE